MKLIKIILALSLLSLPFAASSQSDDAFEIVVEVNDQIITNFEINQRIGMLNAFGTKNISAAEVIDTLINERLFSNSAVELEVSPSQLEIENELVNFSKRGNLSVDELFSYLKSKNISKLTLKAYINAALTQQNVIQRKFINKVFISQNDINSIINSDEMLLQDPSAKIKFIELSFANINNDLRNLKILDSIQSRINTCLDLKIEAKKYENIILQTNDIKENKITQVIMNKLNSLDINETIIINNNDDKIFMLMLCSRNSMVSNSTLDMVRNKIFNKRIQKLGNAYIQELKGEAFINFK